MIVVNKKNQNRTTDLKDFFKINGLINKYGLVFDWRKDHGIMIGPEEYIKGINDIFNKTENFANFTILRKSKYDHEKCTTPFENPCPYYHTALTSMMIPTALALLSFLVMTCCSCCTCCCMQGM